jgi:hypothetical protein
MKQLPLLFLALTVVLALPLRAQTPAPAPDGTDDAASQETAPAPPRNIMPQTINHKPNPTNPPPEIAGPIDRFFKTLHDGDYTSAYETLLADSRLGAQKDKESAIISKTQAAFGLYGKLNDYEIFDNYGIGSNVLVLTYLSRHQEQPLRWRFIYYRADKDWKLINMGFDDVLLDMLD